MGIKDLYSGAYGDTLDAYAWSCGVGRELGEDDESLRQRCLDKLRTFGQLSQQE